MGVKLIINEGDIFGRCTVIEESEPYVYYSRSHGKHVSARMFKVKCACGTIFTTRLNSLTTGDTIGCGCYNKEISTKHGMYGTPTYSTWVSMIQRCCNPNNDSYYNYGAIGISVCDEWKHSFEAFYKDMGERPENKTLNRVGGANIYSKDTCAWADSYEQSYDQKKASNNKSGKTGVCYSKTRDTWMAYIGVKGVRINLGTFKTKEEAITSRKEAEIKYYGYVKE